MTVSNPDIRMVIIIGPTGVGKTELALKTARIWNGEIISADSMQVYRYMDIGTAKPSAADRAVIPHHMIDILDPDEPFNAALFTERARRAVEAPAAGNKAYFVAGGTGLYIKALLGGLVAGPGPDYGLRMHFRDLQERFGKHHLYELLKEKDAKAAAAIDAGDASRIVRALEVWEKTGRSLVDKQQEHRFGDRPYRCLKIGLRMGKSLLFEKIERRADSMILRGFVDEVKWLLERGYHEGLKSMQSIGYRHMASYLRGRCKLEEAVSLMKRDTRQYAKRQMTWFNADGEVKWFDFYDEAAVMEEIGEFLGGKASGRGHRAFPK